MILVKVMQINSITLLRGVVNSNNSNNNNNNSNNNKNSKDYEDNRAKRRTYTAS